MTEQAGDADALQADGRPPAAERHLEVVAVVLLGLAALATAWSGYQASLWDGIQSSDYSQASAARIDAAEEKTAANEQRNADLTLFENHIDAQLDGDEVVADFYRQRFHGELKVAYDAWIALDPLNNPDAPASPLAMPEYRPNSDAEAAELEARAQMLFGEGEEANSNSDRYTLTTLLFAVVLFFAAISERFEYLRVRLSLLAFAAIGLIFGVGVALSQPITGIG